MNDAMIGKYLERINFKGSVSVSIPFLYALQETHLKNVPYENIDILNHDPVGSLGIESLFDKIVTRKRGGYCFELNGLLADLLRSIGFQVQEYFGRWHFGESIEIPRRRHRILKVNIPGETDSYLVDAGVGCDCPRQPLAYRIGMEQERSGRIYRVMPDDRLGFLVQVKDHGNFVPYYSFTEDPHYPWDFDYVHYYCCTAADSVFRQKLFAHRFTDVGRINIENPENNVFILRQTTADGGMKESSIAGTTELQLVLNQYFGISCQLDF